MLPRLIPGYVGEVLFLLRARTDPFPFFSCPFIPSLLFMPAALPLCVLLSWYKVFLAMHIFLDYLPSFIMILVQGLVVNLSRIILFR